MFDWINPLAGWLGLGGVAIAACVAVAIYFPPFRRLAIAAGVAVAGALVLYGKGYRDAEKRKQKEWDDAEKRMVDKGNRARADAERDLAAGGLPNDEFDRDRG